MKQLHSFSNSKKFKIVSYLTCRAAVNFLQQLFLKGISLSKGFNIINRFSEDVDIAIIDESNKSGDEIKALYAARKNNTISL